MWHCADTPLGRCLLSRSASASPPALLALRLWTRPCGPGVWLNVIFEAEQLPTCVADLDALKTQMSANDLAHIVESAMAFPLIISGVGDEPIVLASHAAPTEDLDGMTAELRAAGVCREILVHSERTSD